MPEVNDVSLTTLEVGARATIRRIRNHTPEKLRYLADCKLVPGTPIELAGRAPFNGPVRVKAPGAEHVLGSEMAGDLYVEVIG
jgi:Fe2+ transport system protein FeoA